VLGNAATGFAAEVAVAASTETSIQDITQAISLFFTYSLVTYVFLVYEEVHKTTVLIKVFFVSTT
jgi:hypothetical protein